MDLKAKTLMEISYNAPPTVMGCIKLFFSFLATRAKHFLKYFFTNFVPPPNPKFSLHFGHHDWMNTASKLPHRGRGAMGRNNDDFSP